MGQEMYFSKSIYLSICKTAILAYQETMQEYRKKIMLFFLSNIQETSSTTSREITIFCFHILHI